MVIDVTYFYNPVKIIWGSGQINNLAGAIDTYLDTKKVLILTGKSSLKKSGILDLILKQFTKNEVYVLNDIPSNPEISDLYNIKIETDKFDYDTIIAIGGGSVLDIGKSLIAFKDIEVKDTTMLKEHIINQNYGDTNTKVNLISIPTTAGTGSEVTSWATIWDKSNIKKYSIESTKLYSDIAIIDPVLTVNLPMELTASTALDALSHALEAYWSKRTNEIVRLYSLKAIELIMDNIIDLLDNLDNIVLREKIALGSLYAGLAFSNTKTTVCHSMSYPLTSMYEIPHGIAVSMTLAKVLDLNREFILEKESLVKAFGVAADLSEVEDCINEIYEKAKIPYRLKDYGIKREDIDTIIVNSFTPGRVDNNPVEITREILEDILMSIY